MARNMYGATSADFTLTSGGRVVPGATLTIWSARTGGTQITDLLDVDSVATTTVTSDADGSIVYYGPNNDKTVHWADSGVGSRIAIRPVDITGDPPVLSIGTVGTGAAAASLTGTSEAPVLNLTLPSAGANGVNTAAIQDGAVTPAKLATSGRFVFPTGATGGYGFASGAVHLSGTGSPEGVVTAAPGSTWLQTDATTDVKGWIRWVKATGTGNTGWIAGPEADTGWRVLASWTSGGVVTGTIPTGFVPRTGVAGSIQIRRVGSVVSLAVAALQWNATNPSFDSANIAGFRPRITGDLIFSAYNGSAWNIAGAQIASDAVWAFIGSAGHFVLRLEPTWTTTEAWPSVLPGSAA